MSSSTPPSPTPRVAIACQGGGSHTAFTAGVLKTLLRGEAGGGYRIVAFSGTSGGAICAALAWCGLLAKKRRAEGRLRAVQMLDAFWHDNSALLPWERLWNDCIVSTVELQDRGLLPALSASPYLPQVDASAKVLKLLAPRREFVDLRQLLDKHLNLAEVRQPVAEPRLLVGAVGVLSGVFKAFDSMAAEISTDSILASATLPSAAKAIRIGSEVYWDGLFSQNPPVSQFIEGLEVGDKPDEIWIVRINPQSGAEEPTHIETIQDRRNELAGNLSLNQEIGFITKVNQWLAEGKLSSSSKKPIQLEQITMSAGLSGELDYASKLNRDAKFIARLMADGERRAGEFLSLRGARVEELPASGRA